MPTGNYKPEQIVTILRQIEVQIANGKTAPQACKEAKIHTEVCSLKAEAPPSLWVECRFF